MNKIKIMVSSTVLDLKGERDAVKSAFNDIKFVDLIGVDPVNKTSLSGSARTLTTAMARNCDLYILIVGKEFGYQLSTGKSATETEFDAAFRIDPTKILVFKKEFEDTISIDPKQQEFINRICDYYSGYWRTTFKYTHDLKELVLESFTNWLKKRASFGANLDYLDHFIRIAKQMEIEANSIVYYRLSEKIVELEYIFFGKSHTIQFDRQEIYANFWGCISEIEEQFEKWL